MSVGDTDYPADRSPGIARLTTSGALDPVFGGGSGFVTMNPTVLAHDFVENVQHQPNGMIVVGENDGGLVATGWAAVAGAVDFAALRLEGRPSRRSGTPRRGCSASGWRPGRLHGAGRDRERAAAPRPPGRRPDPAPLPARRAVAAVPGARRPAHTHAGAFPRQTPPRRPRARPVPDPRRRLATRTAAADGPQGTPRPAQPRRTPGDRDRQGP
ncbi:MAG: hypothetical protein GXY03_06110 [Solirubrobacterales bacterium]|nr:hypothetical protein [Solirubrobacterales bacterium]